MQSILVIQFAHKDISFHSLQFFIELNYTLMQMKIYSLNLTHNHTFLFFKTIIILN